MKVRVQRDEIRTCEWFIDVPPEIEEQFYGDKDAIRQWAFEQSMERDEDNSCFREYCDWFDTEIIR